jgi:hypothetical protein
MQSNDSWPAHQSPHTGDGLHDLATTSKAADEVDELAVDAELRAAYGQNAAAAQQDRRQYAEYAGTLQMPQPQVDMAAHGYSPAEGLVVNDRLPAITTGVTTSMLNLPHSPSGLRIGLHRDRFSIVNYSVINIICLCVNVLVFGSCIASLVSGVRWYTVLVAVLALVMTAILLHITREINLVFDKDNLEVRLEERRLYRRCCDPIVTLQEPFSALHGAGFDGGVCTPGELFIDVGTVRLALCSRYYRTESQMFGEVYSWKLYVAQRRGLTLEQLELARAFLEFASVALRFTGS